MHTSLSVFWYLIIFFFFFRLLLHVNHVQPICTFLSCTVMLILIFKSTVYYHVHYFIFCSLYLFFIIHFILCILLCVVFYNICTVHGADLTHISLLVNTFCIIVYVTNKSWTWTLYLSSYTIIFQQSCCQGQINLPKAFRISSAGVCSLTSTAMKSLL